MSLLYNVGFIMSIPFSYFFLLCIKFNGDNMIINIQVFYLAIILVIIGEALKTFEFINTKFILLYLFIISILLNLIFHGIKIETLLESIISLSLSTIVYDIIKLIKNNNS